MQIYSYMTFVILFMLLTQNVDLLLHGRQLNGRAIRNSTHGDIFVHHQQVHLILHYLSSRRVTIHDYHS